MPSANTLVRWVNENAFAPIVRARPCPTFGRPVHHRGGPRRLRPDTSPHTLRIPPHDGHPVLRSAAKSGFRFTLAVSSFRLRARVGFSIPSLFSGQRDVNPAFGYSAPHLSAGGTSTLLNNALLSAHYGGLRPGDNKWANSVVALHARSGKLAWGFQLVHHDLWDYDTASPPLLATLPHDGKNVPVVIQGNKTGFLYVLDRDTGKPVFPVEERAVPQSDIPGEKTSPTQPFPLFPPPLAPQHFSIADAWGPTPADREACREAIGKLRNEGIFTPPSVQGTLAVPGNTGGMNWSGYAFDPVRNLLIVNTNNLIARVRLIPRDKVNSDSEDGEYGAQRGTPYGMLRRFLQSPSDLPCGAPPWGTLTAVDTVKGTIRWQIPLGSMSDFGGAHGSVPLGSISLGGPITTEGGLVFIAGATDSRIRAFNVENGKEVWDAILPAAGNATPMTYEINGKQYLVIAAGGHQRIREESLGDSVVAFALP